jgi:aminoglycoside/choline kinase family phosphotransferase
VTFPATPQALDAVRLETALRARDFPKARVRAVSHEIVGAGFGMAGTCARLTLEGDEVPGTLVAKWAKKDDVRREAHFYDAVAAHLRLRFAGLHAHAVDDDSDLGVLLFEDVAPAEQGDVLVGATSAQAEALVDAMAVWHSTFWNSSGHAVLAPFPAWGEKAEKMTTKTREFLPRFLDLWSGRLPPKETAFAKALPERLPAAYAALAEAPRTVIHDDLHLDNVLFRPDGTPVVLDWTDAKRGPGAVDFARLLVENVTPDARRARQDALALRYAKALAARGVVGYGKDRVLRDAAHFYTVGFAAAVRWAGGPEAYGPDHPRVPLLVESLVRRAGAAAAEAAS